MYSLETQATCSISRNNDDAVRRTARGSRNRASRSRCYFNTLLRYYPGAISESGELNEDEPRSSNFELQRVLESDDLPGARCVSPRKSSIPSVARREIDKMVSHDECSIKTVRALAPRFVAQNSAIKRLLGFSRCFPLVPSAARCDNSRAANRTAVAGSGQVGLLSSGEDNERPLRDRARSRLSADVLSITMVIPPAFVCSAASSCAKGPFGHGDARLNENY